MVNHYHSSDCCPHCLSNNVYIYDRGWRYYLAKLLLNHQLYCESCYYTWKQSKALEYTKIVSAHH